MSKIGENYKVAIYRRVNDPIQRRFVFETVYAPKTSEKGIPSLDSSDSETGYVFQFDVYTGKRDDHTSELGLGANVIKFLTEKVIEEGYQAHIAFDHFFASYAIIQYLYDHGIYATSTVNSNRSDLPLVIEKAKAKRVPR